MERVLKNMKWLLDNNGQTLLPRGSKLLSSPDSFTMIHKNKLKYAYT